MSWALCQSAVQLTLSVSVGVQVKDDVNRVRGKPPPATAALENSVPSVGSVAFVKYSCSINHEPATE